MCSLSYSSTVEKCLYTYYQTFYNFLQKFVVDLITVFFCSRPNCFQIVVRALNETTTCYLCTDTNDEARVGMIRIPRRFTQQVCATVQLVSS